MTTLRIFGDCLDESDVWLDATVEHVDLDGVVALASVDDTRTWQKDLDTVQQWKNDYYAIEHAEIDPDHAVWSAIDTVGASAIDDIHSAREYEIKKAAEDAFTNAVSAQSR